MTRLSGKHGPTAQTWRSMLKRCENEKYAAYPNYGGRGISVCQRWQSYSWFVEDMGERPDGMSIDRIDNNGNYEPGNCRWATPKEQGRNKRTNALYDYQGERLCVAEIAERAGIEQYVLHHRLALGWGIDRAIAEEVARSSREQPFTKLEVCMNNFQRLRQQLVQKGLTFDQIANRVPRNAASPSMPEVASA